MLKDVMPGSSSHVLPAPRAVIMLTTRSPSWVGTASHAKCGSQLGPSPCFRAHCCALPETVPATAARPWLTRNWFTASTTPPSSPSTAHGPGDRHGLAVLVGVGCAEVDGVMLLALVVGVAGGSLVDEVGAGSVGRIVASSARRRL